jgi:peptide/nickel transport system substrate-binding protein
MRARRLIAAVLCAAAVGAAAGCGGGGGGGGNAGSGGGGIKQGGIFTLGTTNYIDTLNPFNYIEAEATMAYLEVFPELVQLGPDLSTYVPDYAKSWSHSADFKTYTYHLQSGGKWSDGKPLTSADVAWTANTVVKYQNGPGAALASAIAHVTHVDTQGPDTVVFHYDAPVDPNLVLSNISALYILPQHIWASQVGSNGHGLKTFRPENNLPLVSGGPFMITKYAEKGTTVFRPNPGWWGPKPHADAVALVYYTNSDSMIADLKSGQISAVDQVPYTAVNALKADKSLSILPYKYGEFTNITWNSNPAKPTNRELLDPRVKKAISECIDRNQIISVVYAGNATLANQSILGPFAAPWQNPADQKLTYDCSAGNATLDQLGYKKGADGIRVAPATTGKYAQPAHKMQYQIMVPASLDFNGDRQFSIIQAGMQAAGIKVTEQAGGDTNAASAKEYGKNCSVKTHGGYNTFDIATWDWFSYADPDFMLSVPTTSQYCYWNDNGYHSDSYDAMYKREGALAGAARKALVAKMDKLMSDQFVYTYLVNEKAISASQPSWGGYHPELNGYNYGYMTEPYQKG